MRKRYWYMISLCSQLYILSVLIVFLLASDISYIFMGKNIEYFKFSDIGLEGLVGNKVMIMLGLIGISGFIVNWYMFYKSKVDFKLPIWVIIWGLFHNYICILIYLSINHLI